MALLLALIGGQQTTQNTQAPLQTPSVWFTQDWSAQPLVLSGWQTQPAVSGVPYAPVVVPAQWWDVVPYPQRLVLYPWSSSPTKAPWQPVQGWEDQYPRIVPVQFSWPSSSPAVGKAPWQPVLGWDADPTHVLPPTQMVWTPAPTTGVPYTQLQPPLSWWDVPAYVQAQVPYTPSGTGQPPFRQLVPVFWRDPNQPLYGVDWQYGWVWKSAAGGQVVAPIGTSLPLQINLSLSLIRLGGNTF
jgi:hypothetical protein